MSTHGAREKIIGLQGRPVSPPVWICRTREVECEEDDNGRHNETTVQCGGCDVVVLKPPAGIAPSDEEVEDGTSQAPAEVDVDARGGKHARTTVDQRGVDVSPERLGESSSKEPGDDGRNSSNEPEPLQGGVDGTVAKDASRTNSSPDDRSSVEYTTTWAGVVVCLIRLTHVRNVSQSPVHDRDLNDGRPERGD